MTAIRRCYVCVVTARELCDSAAGLVNEGMACACMDSVSGGLAYESHDAVAMDTCWAISGQLNLLWDTIGAERVRT